MVADKIAVEDKYNISPKALPRVPDDEKAIAFNANINSADDIEVEVILIPPNGQKIALPKRKLEKGAFSLKLQKDGEKCMLGQYSVIILRPRNILARVDFLIVNEFSNETKLLTFNISGEFVIGKEVRGRLAYIQGDKVVQDFVLQVKDEKSIKVNVQVAEGESWALGSYEMLLWDEEKVIAKQYFMIS